MKAIIQRVTNAKVAVGEEVVSRIGRGLCVLVGIVHNDTDKDAEYIARKLLTLRIFDDRNGKRWQRSVQDEDLEILCVSQFTLYHRLKGNKPDFHMAMKGDAARHLYNGLLRHLSTLYKEDKVKDGLFGVDMQVHIQNDGPVTLELESPKHATVLQEDKVTKETTVEEKALPVN